MQCDARPDHTMQRNATQYNSRNVHCSLLDSFIHAFPRSFMRSIVRSSACSCAPSFVRSSIHVLIHSTHVCSDKSHAAWNDQTIRVLTQRNMCMKATQNTRCEGCAYNHQRAMHQHAGVNTTDTNRAGERPCDSLVLLKAGVNGDRWEVAFDLDSQEPCWRHCPEQRLPASSLSKAMALCTDFTKITTSQLCLDVLRAPRSRHHDKTRPTMT